MLRLLERSVGSIEQRLILVPPPDLTVPATFENAVADPDLREALVRQAQRLRGSIYLSDGAIRQADLSHDGRHRTAEDARSWHLLFLNKANQISSCAWYLEHTQLPSFEHLRVSHCPLTRMDGWQRCISDAVQQDIARAGRAGLNYAELGGWAVAPESRRSPDGLLMALATYALSRALGGALGMTAATVRHSSSSILRRLGGVPLESDGVIVPPYFDDRYDCTMELLRFDSRRPNQKYNSLVDRLRDKLAHVPVIAAAISTDLIANGYDAPERYASQAIATA